MGIGRKRYSAADGMLTYSCITITISHLFVCFSTLELAKLEQQVCSTKICSTKTGYANALLLLTNSNKKGNMVAFNSAYQAKKKQSTFHGGWFEQKQRGVHSFF